MAELANRIELAEQFQSRLQRLNRKQAEEFRRLLGDPPRPDKIPMSFWEQVRRENEDELIAALLLIFLASYDSHRIWGDMEPPSSSTPRDKIALQWTSRRASRVTQDLNRHSIDLLSTAGKAWEMKHKAGETIFPSDIDDLVARIFGPSRTEAIAFTETQQAMIEGGEAGVTHARVEVTRYWGHSPLRPTGHSHATKKPCKICTRYEGLPSTQWRGLRPGSCHPNCDCFIVYVDPFDFVIGTDSPGLIPGNTPGKTWKFRP